jgi:lipid A 3-O-deacylase
MYKLVWFCLFLLGPCLIRAQDTTNIYIKELRLTIDNDVFTSRERDQYYTSGLYVYFRWLSNRKIKKYKIINSISFHQRIYTPKRVSWDDPAEFDRPYAGILGFSFNQEFYLKQKNYLKTSFEVGLMGPNTLTDDFQITWHKVLNIPLPAGWEYQIANSPVINFHGTYARRLAGNQSLDVYSETQISIGTVYNQISEDVLVRLNFFKNTASSSLFGGHLGSPLPSTSTKKIMEGYFFYAPGVIYNAYNATIEGNFIGPKSPHTEIAKSWRLQNRIGFALSLPRFDIVTTYYLQTKETLDAETHQYVGITFKNRF